MKWPWFFLALASTVMGEDSSRITPTVQLIRRVKPAIVPIFAFGPNNTLSAGAGVVIHPRGFILTADHVTRGSRGSGFVRAQP